MREDFLHFLWRYKKFDFSNLKTVDGLSVLIKSVGQYLEKEGPDFFNAQLEIDGQIWAGNVEIHLKSSDWYVHHHQKDENYNNVILHVVWHHDMEVFLENNQKIPVLELKSYVSSDIISNYHALLQQKTWIYCENQIKNIDGFTFKNWQERLFIERLEQKAEQLQAFLSETQNDWEATFYLAIAKYFGLNTNANSFLQMAKAIPYSIIRKEKSNPNAIEALFLGRTGILDGVYEDTYAIALQNLWNYLQAKYDLKVAHVDKVAFFKHRPDNFPTIRLAQLAGLLATKESLFSVSMKAKSLSEIHTLFSMEISEYWKTHYLFDKQSQKKSKKLSKAFINLLIINVIVPMKFVYSKSIGKEFNEQLIAILTEIPPEKNTIIDKFAFFGITSANAYESQSLLQLKNIYCNEKKCMQCSIGQKLLVR